MLSRAPLPFSLLLCAPLPALLLGIMAMRQFGAPAHAWMINAAAIAAGLLLFAIVRIALRSKRPWTEYAFGVLGVITILLPFVSQGMLGVHRWVTLGGIRLHASAIVAPLIIACVAALAKRHELIAIAVAIAVTIILALQPDAAQSFSFAAACIVIAAFSPARLHYRIIGSALLVIAAGVSFTQNDPLSPVPYVEGILGLVASGGMAWAAIGIATLLLLPLPFITVFARGRNRIALALGVYVAMTIVSAMLGPFPVPVMGYGASPILGYSIALALCGALSMPAGTHTSPQ